MNSMEISPLICDFCHEPINGDVIHPCKCDKYYHNNCLQHLIVLDKDPLIIQQCNICQTKYKTKYKTKYAYYIYQYFGFQSQRFFYLEALFGFLGMMISLIITGEVNKIFLGLSLGTIIYSLILWLSISVAYKLYKLTPLTLPILGVIISSLLLILNLSYQENWLDWAALAIISAILVKSKTYLFVLSSYFPYLEIKNYQSNINV